RFRFWIGAVAKEEFLIIGVSAACKAYVCAIVPRSACSTHFETDPARRVVVVKGIAESVTCSVDIFPALRIEKEAARSCAEHLKAEDRLWVDPKAPVKAPCVVMLFYEVV